MRLNDDDAEVNFGRIVADIAKIVVAREQTKPAFACVGSDQRVGSASKTDVADVGGDVPMLPKDLGRPTRKAGINEEVHANDSMANDVVALLGDLTRRKGNRRPDVL